MLEVRDLCFEYAETPVLSDIHFLIKPGVLLHLRGANGSGKTTLLKLLAGILPLQQGQIIFKEKTIHDDIDLYQKNLCFVGHKPGISSLLSPLENSRFDLAREKSEQALMPLIKQFALESVQNTPCGLLSAGQRRRVALMRLVMSNTLIWVMDEPLVALDHKGVELLMNCIRQHLTQGGIVILSSHQSLPSHDINCQEYDL